MSPIFIDSSGVIALLNRSDPYHEKATQLQATLKSQRRPRLTTTAVLLELGDGFARKKRWDLISPFLAAVTADPLVSLLPVHQVVIERAREFRNARLDKDWGLTDCVSFLAMSDQGLDEAFTADRHFQQAGFRAVLLE